MKHRPLAGIPRVDQLVAAFVFCPDLRAHVAYALPPHVVRPPGLRDLYVRALRHQVAYGPGSLFERLHAEASYVTEEAEALAALPDDVDFDALFEPERP